MEYTRGEWAIQLAQPYDEHEFEISYDTEDGLTYPIADVHGKLERGTAEANAQLIASAPRMYTALKAILHGSDDKFAINVASLALVEGVNK